MNFGSAFAGIVSPLFFGIMVDITGSWTIPFGVSVALLVVGAALTFALHPEENAGAANALAGIRSAGSDQLWRRRRRAVGGCAAQQFASLPFLRRRKSLEELNFSGREEGNWNAVAVKYAIAGERRRFCAGSNETREIERVGARDRNVRRAGRIAAPDLPQHRDGVRQRKLLTGKSCDEAAAADLAAALELPENAQELAPWRQP